MNSAAYQALRKMMATGASKHQSQMSRAVENLILACDASQPQGYRSQIPYLDLGVCRAVVRGQVLRESGRANNVAVPVAAIGATSHPDFAGRTPRQCLEAAVEQGELRHWVDLLMRVSPDAVLADRGVDVLVLPDGSGVIHNGTTRWVLASITDRDSSFACVQCVYTEEDTRASTALALYLQNHPELRLMHTEALNAPQQRFQFRGDAGQLEVLTRDELIASAGRLRSLFGKPKSPAKT